MSIVSLNINDELHLHSNAGVITKQICFYSTTVTKKLLTDELFYFCE